MTGRQWKWKRKGLHPSAVILAGFGHDGDPNQLARTSSHPPSLTKMARMGPTGLPACLPHTPALAYLRLVQSGCSGCLAWAAGQWSLGWEGNQRWTVTIKRTAPSAVLLLEFLLVPCIDADAQRVHRSWNVVVDGSRVEAPPVYRGGG